jgi:hypothetical protein
MFPLQPGRELTSVVPPDLPKRDALDPSDRRRLSRHRMLLAGAGRATRVELRRWMRPAGTMRLGAEGLSLFVHCGSPGRVVREGRVSHAVSSRPPCSTMTARVVSRRHPTPGGSPWISTMTGR